MQTLSKDEGLIVDDAACVAYAVDPARRAVVVLDLRNGSFGAERSVITLPASPWSIARSSDRSRLYVATGETRLLRAIDIASGATSELPLVADSHWPTPADRPIAVAAVGADRLGVYLAPSTQAWSETAGGVVHIPDGNFTAWNTSRGTTGPVAFVTSANAATSVLTVGEGYARIFRAGSDRVLDIDSQNGSPGCVSPDGMTVLFGNRAAVASDGTLIRPRDPMADTGACEFAPNGLDVWLTGTDVARYVENILSSPRATREAWLPRQSGTAFGLFLHPSRDSHLLLYVLRIFDPPTSRWRRRLVTSPVPEL